jgi:predicted alpha/beta superfamily hydrolase
MKLKNITIIIVLFGLLSQGQAKYEEFYSTKLDDTRGLKIQLPRNYDPEDGRAYPLVLVLDGDYLFEPVVGNIDYQAYWDDMPDCIVVGVNQSDTRDVDLSFNDDTLLPTEDGALFFEFISMELIPYMNSTFKTTPFRIIVGHDLSANFLNYYLFKDNPIFRAYVALSPEIENETMNRVVGALATVKEESFYYLATSDADLKKLRKNILKLDGKLKTVSNPKIHYAFDDFDEANHYSLVGRAIPKALNQIFRLFKPINGKEYREQILPYDGTPMEYLDRKYDKVKNFYGFDKIIIENDIRAIAAACVKKNDVESLQRLSKLARKEFPDSMINAYYVGLYHEKAGNTKKALQRYQEGLMLKPSQFIDKDILLEKIYRLKEELGQ